MLNFHANFASRLISALAFSILSPAFAAGPAPNPPDIRRDATVRAVEIALPSVVNISAESFVQAQDPLDLLFQDFFGPYNRGARLKSLGSGVIIDSAGYILTNNHVVRRGDRISVTLFNGRSYPAELVAAAPKTDLAVLRLRLPYAAPLTAIQFAKDDDLILGETVLALGNPFGLGESVSRGILSSKTRRPASLAPEELEIEDWLQTDAAINPGNSGGPLVDLRGQLIGLNVAIFRDAQGIGFAIPTQRISQALAGLFTPEQIRSLWLGLRLANRPEGVVVQSVEPGSPAARAGIRPGDWIERVDHTTPSNLLEANRALISAGEKREISIQVRRQDSRRTVSVRLAPEKAVFNNQLIARRLGATVQELTQDLAAALGLKEAQGVLVAEVEENSPAQAAGLRPGYVIEKMDGQPVTNIVGAARWLYRKRGSQTVQLSVLAPRRNGFFLSIYSGEIRVPLRN